jgi:peptidoglycan/xylan/chitin deacetylase (PgdA/CDA1 family)
LIPKPPFAGRHLRQPSSQAVENFIELRRTHYFGLQGAVMIGSRFVYGVLAHTVGPLTAQNQSLLILMYHQVQDSPCGIDYVPTRVFGQQIAFLADSGYKSLTIRQMCENWPDVTFGPKSVVLTFDDMWASHVDQCLPVLIRHGFVGTFFVPTGYVKNHRQRPIDGPFAIFGSDLGSWRDVETLEANGMEIGSHTHTHPMMSSLSYHEVEKELRTSAKILADRVKASVESFSFPFGQLSSYTPWIVSMLPDFGFKSACTAHWGRPCVSSSLLQLPRMNISGLDNMHQFRKKLDGHYDFLRWIRR